MPDNSDDASPSDSLFSAPVTPAHLLAVIEAAVEADEVDLARGGVHTTTVSTRLKQRFGIHREPPTVRDYLRELEAAGEIVRVRGLNPETHAPRDSWLPADHPDLRPSHLPDDES